MSISDPHLSAGLGARVDLLMIADMVEPGSRVLDVGCGDGALLRMLADGRKVDARGIELSRDGVANCVAQGLAVIQGDADTDLVDYPDDSFDYVILSQTIQATRHPRKVLEQMLRVGRRAIVSFPNFGHWRVRAKLMFRGRMPVTENLPDAWYDTPNIHFCTIRDFDDLVREVGAVTERAQRARCIGKPLAPQRALVVLEPVRRAGGVPAEAALGSRIIRTSARPCGTGSRSR